MNKKTKLALAAFAVLVLVALVWWLQSGKESTNDAYVKADILPIMSRVAGTVDEIRVQENQAVQAGEILLSLDTDVLRNQQDEALANVAQAQAAIAHLKLRENAQRAQIQAASAQVDVFQAQWQRTVQQKERLIELRSKQSASEDELDAAFAKESAALASLKQAQASLRVQEATLAAIADERPSLSAAVAQAQARADRAKLSLGYAQVQAPRAGVISNKTVQLGQSVEPGVRLMSLVTTPVWVYANFKETQLAKMQVGQVAEIEVDALKGQVFRAHVDSFFAATGSEFALLPPQNATGNFTKVVQRLPVKLVFEDGQDVSAIRPGMSVTATVRLQ